MGAHIPGQALKAHWFALAAGLFAAACGAITLVGWAAGMPRLIDWEGSGITMKANAAVAALLLGVGMLLYYYGCRGRSFAFPLARLCGAAAALLAVLTLSQHITGTNLGIDTLLFDELPDQRATAAPGRMGPPASTSFTLLGIGLVLLTYPRYRIISLYLALAATVVSMLSVTGYIYGASAMYELPRLTGIAFQTAIAIFFYSLGMIAAMPEREPMQSLLSSTAAGAFVRRLLPLALVVPVILGVLRLSGQNAGYYDMAFGTAMRTVVEVCLLVALIYWALRAVKSHESSRAHLAAIVEHSPDAIVSKSIDGTILTWNAGAEKMFGYSAAEAVGNPIALIIPEEKREEEKEIIKRIETGEVIANFETVRVTKDGSCIDVSLAISPIRDGAGRISGISKVARDITERKRAEAELARLADELRLVTDAVPALISYVDSNHRYRFNNRAYEVWFGQKRDEITGRHLRDVLGEDAYRKVLPYAEAALRGEQAVFETELPCGDGGKRFVRAEYVPHILGDGQVTGYYSLVTDITQLKRAEKALLDADRRKDEFLATLAHELRNPMAAVRGAVDLARHGNFELGPLGPIMDVLDRQSRHLVRLTDDLLDISRITRNKISLRNEQVELSTILKETIDTFRPACDEGGVELEAELPSEPVYLTGDSARLAQIFGNLLNNACKFTGKGGRVSVAVERQNGHAVVRVRDSGIGIAPEKIPHIFEMFVQADTSMSRATAGLGIGLTLVKTMVEMHGGSVEAVSDGPGSGSEFIVKLPAVDGMPSNDASPASMPGDTLPRLSILLVDDNADAVAALSMLFRLRGNRVEVSGDAETALKLFDKLRPDVVILDIGLPGMDGHDLIREIRRRSHGKNTILIALSGWGRDEDIVRSLEAGCDLHLVKPVEQNELLEQIEKLVAARQLPLS